MDNIPRDTSYTIWSTYLKNKKRYPDVRPVWPDLPKGVKAKNDLVYARLDSGRELHLNVYYPKGKKKQLLSGILMIHGGGWDSGLKDNLVPMAQQLAKAGYVTVAVEYRLSPEAPYPAGVCDLKAAVRWMRANATRFRIDTSRIACFGGSAGAHLASLLGATNGLSLYDGCNTSNSGHSSDVQAVLNIDGILSFIHPDAEPEKGGPSSTKWLGSIEENYERWKEASPMEYAGKNTPPFLFVNSSQPRFHAGRDDFIKILDQYGTYSEVHTLEGSPHAFWLLDPWFEPTLQISEAFLKKIFN